MRMSVSNSESFIGRRLLPRAVSAAALLGVCLFALVATAGGQTAGRAPRILYASDWSGSGQVYSIDPSGGRRGQLTFGPAPGCPADAPCGFGRPIPSPDGRWLLFWEAGIQVATTNLYLTRADGSHRRAVGRLNNRFEDDAVWSPDSLSIAYTRADGIHIVGVDGSDRRVSTNRTDISPAWSPDGRSFAFVRSGVASVNPHPQVVVIHAGRRRTLATAAKGDLWFRWSPSGALIAYGTDAGLFVVRPDGSRRRRLLTGPTGSAAWSADGHSLASAIPTALTVIDVVRGSVAIDRSSTGYALAWSPKGHLLAFNASDGIRVRNAAGRTRLVNHDTPAAIAWSPDATMLAYLTQLGDLKIVTLSGRSRTLVAAAGDQGGGIAGVAWTLPPAGTHYRPPEPRTLATVTSDGIETRWPVERLAADGPTVAYVACGHTFAWTPASGRVVQAEPTTSLSPNCRSESYYTSYRIYALGLAGSRLAVAGVEGGNGRSWWMGEGGIQPGTLLTELGKGFSTNGGAYSGTLVGEPAGSGDLLVFGAWTEAYSAGPYSPIVTTSEGILRADPGGCPCQTIASSPGPLTPFDVDAGRIVAGGDNATWLLDANGKRLLTLPVSPRAAQLSGNDLVVLVPGELRDYDARTGVEVHAWPLPNVDSGTECATPNSIRCSSPPRLVLEDASSGLATFILDGQVHVLRLTDGKDVTVGAGSLARFMNAGLVYVDGSRLHLVPYDQLPLR
jgi:hypothetical protein